MVNGYKYELEGALLERDSAEVLEGIPQAGK